MGRLLVGAIWIYCVGIIALAIAWAAGDQGIWWLNLANVFALYLFAPLLVLAPVSWLMPARRLRAATALAIAAFIGLFGVRLIPPSAPPTGGTPFQVATFNLHHSLEPSALADRIAAIRAQSPDVIVLQELSAPAAQAFQRELSREYPYQALKPSASLDGMGVISRYPLKLQTPPPELDAQSVLISMGSVDVTLINVSLASPELKRRRLPALRWMKVPAGYQTRKRSRDIEQLLQAIDRAQGPLVVAGDFNLSDREADYSQFAARLHDVYREASWGFGHTYPSSVSLAGIPIALPLTRIDYIWSAGGVVPAAARVACGGGSDHCMVIADVQIGDGSAQSSAVR
jgi:endonuclease/exonuclease/phosphatase (EEP) superfamily protein YafD